MTIAIVLAMGALCTGAFVSQHLYSTKRIDSTQFHGTYLDHPRAINEFKLVGTDQKAFDNTSLKGKWTLVFFGFTNCGYLCPTTMAELAKMYRILDEKKVNELPQIVMVSIDPERDSLDKLHQYVTSFETSFHGARGDEAAIQLMTREMGIAYAKLENNEATGPQNYDIQHSGALMLFNPEGKLNAFFTSPHHADLLAKDYMMLIG
jgi:protein SCO1/2